MICFAMFLASCTGKKSPVQDSVLIFDKFQGHFSPQWLKTHTLFSNNSAFVVTLKNSGKLEMVILIFEMKGLFFYWLTGYWALPEAFFLLEQLIVTFSHLSGAMENRAISLSDSVMLGNVFMQIQEYLFYFLAKHLRQRS